MADTRVSSRVSLLVDARALHSSGIGRYLREILRGIATDDRFGPVTLLGEPDPLNAFAEEFGGARFAVLPHRGGFYSPVAQLSWLALRARGVRADVAFFPHYDAPFFAHPPRSVVAVQDLTHFRVPELFPAWQRRAGGLLFDRVVERAGSVVVSSESTRRDLAARLPGLGEKVHVIPLGVDSFFSPSGVRETEASWADALHPFVLCVGNRKAHKNLRAAVEALAIARREWPELRLVVAGYPFADWDSVARRAGELGVEESIVEISGPDDDTLRALYASCEALLFPSLYEGFGLPVLEAMGCGAPVVASDRASIPEVAGGAALLVDPLDHAAWARAVLRIRQDGDLRERLVASGHSRARHLTWARTAARTADLLYATANPTRVPEPRGAIEYAS